MKDLSLAHEDLLFHQIFEPEATAQNATDDFVSWWPRFIDLLYYLPYPKDYFQRLVYSLKVYYRENPSKSRQINEFELDYKPDKAIEWYTRDSFVHRIVNQALRQQNIEVLFLFGFFLQDIYRQLGANYKDFEQINVLQSKKIILYRGQFMSRQEFDRLQSPYTKYLVNNSFFSTSYQLSVAEIYFDPNISGDMVGVLFEIEVDLQTTSRPYSNIQRQSWFRNGEEEYLFMPGTLFQKLDVLSDKIQKVRLKLNYNSIVDFQYEDENRNLKNYVIQLGRRLYYKITEEDRDLIFTKLIDLFPAEYLWLSAIQLRALAHYQDYILEDYTSAIVNYREAINRWKQLSEDDIDAINAMAMIYDDLACCYEKLASQCFDQSISLCKIILDNPIAINIDRVNSQSRLVEVYESKSKTESGKLNNENLLLAVKHQEQAIEDMLNDSFYTVYDIAYGKERLGRLCELAHDYGKAITAYQDTIEICLKDTELDLFQLISLHQSIATIYFKYLKNYPLAIEYQQKTHQYILKKYELEPMIHQRTEIQYNTRKQVYSYIQLADIYLESNNYSLARENLNAVINLYGYAEQELEDDRKIISNIHEKLKNMP